MTSSTYFKISLYLLSISYILNAFLSFLGYRKEADISLTFLFLLSLILSVKEWRSGLLMFASGSLVGFAMEYVGINYGLPFGRYKYLKFEGAKVLGVPIPIIFAWGIYLFISYTASSYLFTGVARDLFTSLLMVILDMAIDPVMTSLGVWKWMSSGPWFGIPLENFIGWFFTSFMSLMLYRIMARDDLKRSLGATEVLPYFSSFLPIIAISDPRSFLPALISPLIALSMILLLKHLISSRSLI